MGGGAAPGVCCGVGVRLGGGGLGSRRAVCWSEVGMRRSVTHRCFSEAARAAHPVHPCGPTAQHRAAVPPWGCGKTPRGPLGRGEGGLGARSLPLQQCCAPLPALRRSGGEGRGPWVAAGAAGWDVFALERPGFAGGGLAAWRGGRSWEPQSRTDCPALPWGGGCEVLEGVMGRCGEAPSVRSGGSFGLSWC